MEKQLALAFPTPIGRFKVRDPLGPAAETLDALHDAKAKAEQDAIYKKMASGDPNDLFDAAEGLGGAFAKLAEGVLAPKKLVPTYKQLVQDSRPPLPPEQAELVTHRFPIARANEALDATKAGVAVKAVIDPTLN